MKRIKKITIWGGIILVALLILVAPRLFGRKPPVQFQTKKVARGTIVSSISASGQILTANVINITTQATGLVKNVYVKNGQKVYEGQVLADLSLDSDSSQKAASAYSAYLSAKNALASAQSNLYTLDSTMWAANQKFINDAVSRNLSTSDPTYIQENDNWQAAQANYLNQKNVVTQAQAAVSSAWLSYGSVSSKIVAPENGMIDNITINPGLVLANNSSRIAVISREGNPMATFNVSEVDVSRVKPGQKATVTLDSIVDKTFTGKVLTVDKIGNVSSGVTNYPVVLAFDTTSDEILANMAATARIIIEAKSNVLFVPPEAVQTANGVSTVQILKGGKVQTIVVETGLSSDTQIEIISGLSEGETVITGTISKTSSSRQGASSSPFSTFRFGGGGGAVRVGGGGR